MRAAIRCPWPNATCTASLATVAETQAHLADTHGVAPDHAAEMAHASAIRAGLIPAISRMPRSLPPAGTAPRVGVGRRKSVYRPCEVAGLFAISLASVYRGIEGGDLPAFKVLGSWRIPVDELHRRFPALGPRPGQEG